MSFKLQTNDLVSVQPWDCEGIERPWGWFPDNPPPKLSEPAPPMRKFNKVKKLDKVKSFRKTFEKNIFRKVLKYMGGLTSSLLPSPSLCFRKHLQREILSFYADGLC
jgi:hypothetical protein